MRFVGIDIFRQFLAIFVIIQHCWSTSRYSENMYSDYLLLADVVNGAVWGFFFISGFFTKERDRIAPYIADKFNRLIIPFLVFSIIYGVLNIFIWGKGVSDIFMSIASLQGTSMQLYFLPYLFIVDIVFVYLFSCFKKYKIQLTWFFFISLILSALAFSTESSTGSDVKLIPYYALAYITGMLYSQYRNLLSMVLLICSSFVVGLAFDERFLDISFMLAMFIILLTIFKNSNLNIFGAGGVYLLHTPYTNFIISIILFKIGVLGWLNLGLTVFLTYIFCIFMTYIFMKSAPKYRYLLLE